MTFLEQQFGLSGQAAVVFGGGSGMGKATSRYLAEAGAAVCVADLDGDAAGAVAASLTEAGFKASAQTVNVAEEAEVAATFAEAERALGPVSIMVNCAGIFPSALIDEQSVEAFDRLSAVNFRGAFLTIREGSKAIRRAGRDGRMILISSVSSVTPGMVSMGAYSATKAGVNALVRTAALEYGADGITVNAIMPGDTLTEGAMKSQMSPHAIPQVMARPERRPIKRIGSPEDMAQAVLALAAPGAGFLTGQCLAVDGGQLAS